SRCCRRWSSSTLRLPACRRSTSSSRPARRPGRIRSRNGVGQSSAISGRRNTTGRPAVRAAAQARPSERSRRAGGAAVGARASIESAPEVDMARRRFPIVLATALLGCALLPGRADARRLTLEDYYRIVGVQAPAMSPDGQWVAFIRTTIVEAENRRQGELWIV